MEINLEWKMYKMGTERNGYEMGTWQWHCNEEINKIAIIPEIIMWFLFCNFSLKKLIVLL